MDEEGDQDYTVDGSDDEDDTNLMDYVHKKVKKKVEPSIVWRQFSSGVSIGRRLLTSGLTTGGLWEVFPMSSPTQSIQLLPCSRLPKWIHRHQH